MGGRAGDADTHADTRFAILLERIFAVECHGHAMGGSNRFRRRSALQQNSEFIAAEAGSGVTFAQIDEQAPADFLEQQVAGGMAETVIDLLEAVEIQTKQRGRIILARRRQHLVETLIEQQSIWKLGQDIVLRQELDTGFGAPSFRDVFVSANPSAVRKRLVVDGNQSAVAQLLEESIALTAVNVRFPFPVDIFDGPPGIIADSARVGEDIVEPHSHPQCRQRLVVDAAELLIDELQAVLRIVQADALRHVDDRLLEALTKRPRRRKAPGEIVPNDGSKPRQLAMSCIDRPQQVLQSWRNLHGHKAASQKTKLIARPNQKRLLICLIEPW